MAAITVRNLPEEVHRALKVRAARHGRSTEAEVRLILQETVVPRTKIKVGSELAALGRRFGGIDLKIARDKTPAEPAKLG
jgi:antitoxin FitA